MDSKVVDKSVPQATAMEASIRKVESRNMNQDDSVLASLGHEQHMTRKFGLVSMLALAFTILGTWVSLAASLGAGLSNGGTISLLYGLVFAGVCMHCLASSLGELLSVYPTSLGQAYFIIKLAPKLRYTRIVSYVTGWINVSGWWSILGSFSTYSTAFYVAIIQLFHPDFVVKPWHNFLIFEVTIWAFCLFNIVATRHDRVLPVFNSVMLYTNIMIFVALIIALLVSTSKNGSFQSGKFIFATWINLSGWPDGFSFFLGLLSATYGFTAFDSVIHMIEELPKPEVNGPKAMVYSIWTGAGTGAILLVVLFACIQSLDLVLETPYGLPFVQILYDVVGQKGTIALIILIQVNTVISGASIVTAGSRLTYSFARDHGLPFSHYFAHVNEYWQMPVRATVGQCVIVSFLGIFFFASQDTLFAVLSLSTITLVVAAAMPVAFLLWVGRGRLPVDRAYNLGRKGVVYNIVGVAFACLISVVFFFPAGPDPTIETMNWAIVAFGGLVLLASASWVFGAKRNYSISTELQASPVT